MVGLLSNANFDPDRLREIGIQKPIKVEHSVKIAVFAPHGRQYKAIEVKFGMVENTGSTLSCQIWA